MTQIRAIILVHHKFDTNKDIKELVAVLLVDNKFICQNYRKETK